MQLPGGEKPVLFRTRQGQIGVSPVRECGGAGGEVAALQLDTPPRSRGGIPSVVWLILAPDPPLSHEGSAGARNRATVSDCLAAAGKARFRAPFGGFSRATPVPLRHLIPRGGGSRCNLSLHARDVLPFAITGSPEQPTAKPRRPDHHPRLVSECLLCLTGTPEPFSAPRRTIFCTGPGMELCVVSPHQQHRSRLDASPCVVADAGRSDYRMSSEGRGKSGLSFWDISRKA